MTLASERIEIDVEPASSGVAWGAVIGGAVAAAAISLILMVLGSGLGFSVISPWANMGASAAAVAVGSVIWLVVMQWIASAFGGYLSGRMRERAEPSDEVFFRDTANGFLAWALSTIIVAALLTSALSAIVGTGAQVAATVASGVATGVAGAATGAAGAVATDPNAYFVDTLFRPGSSDTAAPATTAPADAAAAPATAATAPAAAPADTAVAAPSTSASSSADAADVRAETGRILTNGLMADEFPAADADYLAGLVAERSGLSPDAAKQRVTDVVTKMQAAKTEAQAAADAARKAAARLSLFMFLALLVGAFIASAAAALGGAHRDEKPVTLVR